MHIRSDLISRLIINQSINKAWTLRYRQHTRCSERFISYCYSCESGGVSPRRWWTWEDVERSRYCSYSCWSTEETWCEFFVLNSIWECVDYTLDRWRGLLCYILKSLGCLIYWFYYDYSMFRDDLFKVILFFLIHNLIILNFVIPTDQCWHRTRSCNWNRQIRPKGFCPHHLEPR